MHGLRGPHERRRPDDVERLNFLMDTKKKIYCFNNSGHPGLLIAQAICEDGHALAQHCCSHECYMAHDLGLTSSWKHELYDAHCGPGGWELVWIADPATNAELDAAYKLNQKLGEAARASEPKAGVTLEFTP